MGGHPIPIDPQILLRESAWVYALARSLVGDPSTADDIVQETWLAALRRPPRARERGQVRAFLATVVRRVAGSTARDRANRRLRERAASRDEVVAPESEGLERLALQRQLADALLELREPYRTAIVLRYVEGLAPREIAVQLDVSPEAVRTRISRGLDLLRERFDRDHGGDRAAWSLVLGGLAHREAEATAIASVFAGGSIMALKPLLVAFATLIATATLWTWLRTADEGPPPLSTAVAPETPRGTDVATAALNLDVPTSQADEERAPIAGPAPKRNVLRGRVVSALDRRPLAGARIALQVEDADRQRSHLDEKRDIEARLDRKDAPGAEKAAKQLDEVSFAPFREGDVLATCGEDGRFELDAPPDGDRALLATANDHLAAVVKDRSLFDDGEVEIALAPAGMLDVDVVDAAGLGLAQHWLSVGLVGTPAAGRPLFDALPGGLGYGPSDGAGRISIGGLPVGIELTINLVPQPGQRVRAMAQNASIDPEERRGRVTLRVESSGALHGEARPAPVAEVAVQARYAPFGSTAKPLTTNVAPDGTFLFERVPAGAGTLELATIRRTERATSSLTEPLAIEIAAGETTEVGVIDLPDTVRIRGHARDWRDASADFFVDLRFLRNGRAIARTSLDDKGRFEAWLPSGECVIEVVNQGRVLAAVAAQAPSDDFELDLLAWCAALSGRVSAAAGEQPMMFPHLASGDPSSPGWSPSTVPQHGPFRIKDGAFRALPLEPGRYSLLVPFGTRGAAWIPRIDLVRGHDTDVGELAIGFGSVRGHIVGTGNEPAGGVEVLLSSPFDRVLTTHASRRAIAGEHGEFGFDGVPTGPWQVSIPERGGALGRSSLADVFPNASTEIEVALLAEAKLSVSVTSHGEPQNDVELALSHLDGPSPALVDRTDGAGRIERDGLLPGTWRWSIGGKPALRAGTVTLRAGELRTLDIDVGAGAVVFRVAASTEPALWISEAAAWSLEPDTAGEMRCARANRGGTFELDVDAGRYLLVMQVRSSDGRDLAAHQQRTAVVELAAGAREVDIAMSDVALELRRDGHARHTTPPSAVLVALAGLSTESWAISFPSSALDSSLRFSSLPPGAILRLQGTLAPGGPIERVVAVPQSGVLSLDWR